ncbi:NAD(P)-dependent dehydrogenase (short-subunit alcohol dehydrogenase family) [Kitasatospora sp. MAP12-15]|uniref:SDR family NAD(P)-dependent oxidoreductase n=1 Tax=unclassified Kitasatospora TaxID=2633591 RepID=UPI0024744820|nr:SDR family NAD(P)-dependent oxidoreductase [Kitasatospora sp. MAP12-44]MDH6109684.1 NAD(P)-dependent dehydrogenase (short-subunit alcohol dehydrogenase family) [Kitasatospora sp. MAP12-44]
MTGAYGDQRIVVTGAGNGIGAALAAAFAAEGARVVVNDLDADAARHTAAEIGALAVAVPGDAATREGVTALIEAARAELGGIDVYCANAGVPVGGGPEAAESVWAAAWEVNVMAHVRAADLLLPDWLERGSGRFVSTVSAAGLLTMLGAAPYSVSKHAALAFAEWLSATYRHRGIKVHALCPLGVRTQILTDAGEWGQALLAADAIEPDDVARAVLAALAAEQFLILPHPEVADYYAGKAADPGRWLGAMNHLQQKITGQKTIGQKVIGESV